MTFSIGNQSIVASTTPCNVIADSDEIASKIWFRSPAIDQNLIEKLVEIQLETKSRDQGLTSFANVSSWSWFDIIILDSPEASEPKVKDGLALVWFSHNNEVAQPDYTKKVGPALLDGKHSIFNGLDVGNALAVRVCARFPGWENHASEGRLILRTSDKGRRAQRSQDKSEVNDLKTINEQTSKVEESLNAYLDDATPGGAPPAYSILRGLLSKGPLRADQATQAGEPPLRLLSFDGGGVRGIRLSKSGPVRFLARFGHN
ncbi:hypothetical protein FPV67DRAFT_1096496 [Lyophyllum atratum]|nr:hypothetical protein FPV67DRAFT_1096496 [Lyophyllum atratum]